MGYELLLSRERRMNSFRYKKRRKEIDIAKYTGLCIMKSEYPKFVGGEELGTE
jgi:hypothetical protein